MDNRLYNRRTVLAGSAAALSIVAGIPSADAAGKITLGAYTTGMDTYPSRLNALAARIGQPLGVASIFRGNGDVWPGPVETALTAGGRTLLVSWHLEYRSYGHWTTKQGRREIADVARRVKAFGRPVAIRPWAEMNGDWQPHQPVTSWECSMFVAAWRSVVDVFRAEGVTNVRWVFNPTTDTYAETTDVRRIWPGSSYVDVLGLDGYNWGTGGIFTWRSFYSTYHAQYHRLVRLAPTKPLWICEIGCADPLTDPVTGWVGGKGKWWTDAAGAMKYFPAVRAVVLFDIDKERDWRAASSTPALAGLRAASAQLRQL